MQGFGRCPLYDKSMDNGFDRCPPYMINMAMLFSWIWIKHFNFRIISQRRDVGPSALKFPALPTSCGLVGSDSVRKSGRFCVWTFVMSS